MSEQRDHFTEVHVIEVLETADLLLALTLSLAWALTWMLALTLNGLVTLTDRCMDFGLRDADFRTISASQGARC